MTREAGGIDGSMEAASECVRITLHTKGTEGNVESFHGVQPEFEMFWRRCFRVNGTCKGAEKSEVPSPLSSCIMISFL
jgi:hypothetical protein